MVNSGQHSVWTTPGKNKYFENYRLSERSEDLRNWVNEAYYKKCLGRFLDKDFVEKLKNEDFYGRLWELELAEWFMLTDQNMVPTNGTGPDFCIELDNGSRIWVEAVLARADEELDEIHRAAIASKGKAYNTPRQETALRFSTSLVGKANKIKQKYSDIIGEDDYTLIAISAFQPGPLRSDIDLFMLSILPIEHQVIHFSTDGSEIDTSNLPTHTVNHEYIKKSGSKVKKEFLLPGTRFPYIDGVIFSEASNLQNLLGIFSNAFNDSTNIPHIFANYSGKKLPASFTSKFYFHQFKTEGEMVSLKTIQPDKN